MCNMATPRRFVIQRAIVTELAGEMCNMAVNCDACSEKTQEETRLIASTLRSLLHQKGTIS